MDFQEVLQAFHWAAQHFVGLVYTLDGFARSPTGGMIGGLHCVVVKCGARRKVEGGKVVGHDR